MRDGRIHLAAPEAPGTQGPAGLGSPWRGWWLGGGELADEPEGALVERNAAVGVLVHVQPLGIVEMFDRLRAEGVRLHLLARAQTIRGWKPPNSPAD
ncbi:hypothetical protein [Streptomyces melanogenes]|uniref:hypothetical protein n=1 Tax=Streptomyces melanogenes TaxID=67326 RepID=UPI003798757D